MSRTSAKTLIRLALLVIVATAAYYSTEKIAMSLVPILSLVGLLLILTFAGMLTHKTRRENFRISRGLCASCGYDLRGTPHRCPECGTPSTLLHTPNRGSS